MEAEQMKIESESLAVVHTHTHTHTPSIQLINGDCYEKLKEIPSGSVDLVVIDPPYNFMAKHQSENYTGAGAFGKLGRSYHRRIRKQWNNYRNRYSIVA